MQPQKKQQNQPVKKKVKNKGWSQEQPDQPINMEEKEQRNKKYKSITEMGSKYHIDMNAVLGSGFASAVYLGTRISDSLPICVKAVDLLTFGSSDSPFIQLIHQEIECLQKFQSQHIVQLLDVYESPTFYYLVMELCQGGDLFKMMKMAPYALPIHFVNTIIEQTVQGIEKIHTQGMIHRDLKTENIFIKSFPKVPEQKIRVKIGDLGFCIKIAEIEKLSEEGKKAMNVGSPIYMSPQVCQSHTYSQASDIYALGIIWYELLFKVAPWQALSEEQLLEKKLNQQISKWREDMPESLKNIIAKCLDNTPQNRPSCTQIFQFLSSQAQQSKK